MRSNFSALSLIIIAILVAPAPQAQTFREYAGAGGYAITPGPDGALWFGSYGAVGRITTDGAISKFTVPNTPVYAIALGSDGALWFTEINNNKIGRITTAGTVTEFAIPTANSSPYGITAGPDGNLWFTEQRGSRIGRITTSGAITEFPLPSGYTSPKFITVGPDNNLWFTQWDALFRLTTSGSFTTFDEWAANAIAGGPDGTVWWIDNGGDVVRTSVDGKSTLVGLVSDVATIDSFTFDSAGNVYIPLPGQGKIVRITPTGVKSDLNLPSSASIPTGVTRGPDGNIWSIGRNRIAVLELPLRKVLPVVGSLQGAFGSMFRTSLQLHNCTTSAMTGKIVFHPAGVSGTDSDPSISYSLDPDQTTIIPDLLPSMSRSGVGSADVVASSGDFPLVLARIYNDAGTAGTSGFTEDALASHQAINAGGEFDLLVPDLGRYRLNVGVRTLSNGASVTITQHNAAGTVVRTLTKTYSPTYFEQIDAAAFLGGAITANDSIRVHVDAGSLFVYGATTDNTTQDPSMQISRN